MWNAFKVWLAGESANDLESLRFQFNFPFSTGVGLLLLIALAAVAALLYWPRLGRLKGPARIVLVALRTLVLVLALFMFLDPCIVGDRVKAGEEYVVLLFDDSKSMQVIGADGLSRGDRLLAAYHDESTAFEEKLGGRFQLARYSFAKEVQRIQSAAKLNFAGGESDLVGSVRDSLRDLEGLNVAAVVLFSDGVHQTGGDAPNLDVDLPDGLHSLARTQTRLGDVVMAARSDDRMSIGLQFHPESILTPAGPIMIERCVAELMKGR